MWKMSCIVRAMLSRGIRERCRGGGLFPGMRQSFDSIALRAARRIWIMRIVFACLDESKLLKPVHGLKQHWFRYECAEGIIPTTCWIRHYWAKSYEFETGAQETATGRPIPSLPRRSKNCCRSCTSPDRKESFGRLWCRERMWCGFADFRCPRIYAFAKGLKTL